jgi:hypothetical protein
MLDRDLAVTGANGVFRVGPLRPGAEASFEVAVDGRTPRSFRVTVPEEGGVSGVEVLFGGDGGAVEGRLLHGPAPVAGVVVRLHRAATSVGKGLLASRTGPDGTFRFDEVPPGDYRVETAESGFRNRYRFVTVAAGETARADLGGDAAIHGTLTDDGAPVGRAIVRITRVGATTASAQDETRPDGTFRIEGIEPGPWRVGVQTLGAGAFQVDVRDVTLTGGENRVDVALGQGETAGEIAGKVFARTGGVPLGSDRVQITLHVLEEKAEGAWAAGAQVAMAFADDEGHYRVRGLRAGRYRVRAVPTRTPLLGPVDVDVALAWNERRGDADLALPDRVRAPEPPTACRLTGTVVDADGRPVPNAEVKATSAADANRSSTATTDDAGRWTIRGLVPGTWRVSVASYGPGGFLTEVAETTLVDGDNSLPIRLDHADLAGEIRGRVFAASSGRPLGPKDVSVVLHLFGEVGPRFVGIASVADDGSIRFRSLREGRYRISVHPRAGTYRMRDVDVPVARGEKVAGVAIGLEDLASGKVVVVARDDAGRPVTDVLLVFGSGASYVQGSTNAHSSAGVFETWVEAGTHDLTVRTWSGALTATTSVTVRAGETTKAEVVLRAK